MDDNKNQNQPNQAAADYQKILDEYASSVKPEDANPETESKKPEIDLNITTSLKEAPIKPEENKIPEIKPDITENIPKKPTETYLKGINSPQLESPVHPSLAANLEENDIPPVSTPKYDQISQIPTLKPEEDIKPIENNPEPLKTTTFESPIKPLEPEDSQPEKTPEEIKAEINRLLEDDTSQTSPDSTPPKNGSTIGKVFFIFALVLFLAIAAGLAYFLFLSPSDSNNSNNSVTPTVTPFEDETENPPTSSGSCDLNGKTYQVGESFASADGCNTCSCSADGVIACTEMACSGTPTVTSATSSASTSDWKTYTNQTFKYSINYPKKWIIKTENNHTSLQTPEYQKRDEILKSIPGDGPGMCGSYGLDCFKNIDEYSNAMYKKASTAKNLSEYFSSDKDSFLNFKQLTINGFSAYEVKLSGMVTAKSYFIEKKDNSFCEISFCDQKLTNDENLFLTSFKFN